MTLPSDTAPSDRFAALSAAMQASRHPQTEALLCALLIDALAQLGTAASAATSLPEKNSPPDLGTEIATLVAVDHLYRETNQSPAFNAALEELVDRVFYQTVGLTRQRLLTQLWSAIPHSMKAYGLLRSSFLDSSFNDLLLDYPDEQVPEHDLVAWITLAQAALRAGEHAEAQHILSILNAEHPENPFILELLANALIAGGDFATGDALYRQLETDFAWPASLIRVSDQAIESYRNESRWDDPPEQFSWLPFQAGTKVPGTKTGRIFVVGVDDRYAQRYLPGLLESLTRTYPDGAWLLHVHLVNPARATLDWIARLQQAGTPVAATSEQRPVRPSETRDTRRTVEMRTYYACARFRVLPELLAHYARPLWVIDADMQAQRPIDTLFAETGQAEAGKGLVVVPMEARGRCLYEYIWLSLSYYAPTPETLAFTRTLARYINHHLANDHWGWGLDQAAFFAVLAWFERHVPALEVARISSACIADGLQNHPKAFFASLVGSMNSPAPAARHGTVPG